MNDVKTIFDECYPDGLIPVSDLHKCLHKIGCHDDAARAVISEASVHGETHIRTERFCLLLELPDALVRPPPTPLEQIAEWRCKYKSIDSLVTAVQSEDTILIRGNWLLEQIELECPLSKRQKLPGMASWTPSELLKQELPTSRETVWKLDRTRVMLVSLSYAWATPTHPDPHGEQLQRLCTPVTLLLADVLNFAMFIDWCSLYQAPRTPSQEASFKGGLKHVNLWYAHPLTYVWLLTVVPYGVSPYTERGWPMFERSIAGLVTHAAAVQNLGRLALHGETRLALASNHGVCVSEYDHMRLICCSHRPPPRSPAAFRNLIATLHFTNGADRAFVLKKYYETFREVMMGAETLRYSKLNWTDDDAAQLVDILPWCVSLRVLSLKSNAIEKLDANMFRHCGILEHLHLEGNPLKEVDRLRASLEEVLPCTCIVYTGRETCKTRGSSFIEQLS